MESASTKRHHELTLTPEQILGFHRDGFLVVPEVFSRDEIAGFREAAERHAADTRQRGMILPPDYRQTAPVGDLLSFEGLDRLVFDERLLTVAKQVIGRDRVVYFGDSGFLHGEGTGRGFHKDNTERVDGWHPDWRTPFTMVRFGLYLQDHVHESGGLKVRRGSHLHNDVSSGGVVNVKTREGDLALWSMRTSHSGNAVRFRGARWLALDPRWEVRVPRALWVPHEKTRIGLFASFGVDDHHLRNYIAKHENQDTYPNNYLWLSWLHSRYPKDLIALGESRGCDFVKPIPDYGSRYDPSARNPRGHVEVGHSAADQYPLTRLNRWLRRARHLKERLERGAEAKAE